MYIHIQSDFIYTCTSVCGICDGTKPGRCSVVRGVISI